MEPLDGAIERRISKTTISEKSSRTSSLNEIEVKSDAYLPNPAQNNETEF